MSCEKKWPFAADSGVAIIILIIFNSKMLF
jgi:hypothetical protein